MNAFVLYSVNTGIGGLCGRNSINLIVAENAMSLNLFWFKIFGFYCVDPVKFKCLINWYGLRDITPTAPAISNSYRDKPASSLRIIGIFAEETLHQFRRPLYSSTLCFGCHGTRPQYNHAFRCQARRNVFVSGGYKFVQTLYNLVVKVVCLKFWHKLHLWLGGYRGYKSWTWGYNVPPVPIVPTPLFVADYFVVRVTQLVCCLHVRLWVSFSNSLKHLV